MASADYDEDLETNPFFVRVRRDFPDLFQQCLAEGLIMAVPRRGSIVGVESFERDDILRHILVVSEDFSLTRFFTINGDAEVITGGVGDAVKVVKTDAVDADSDSVDGSKNEISTKLLFSETFYDEHMNKLQLWCVSDPFFKINCTDQTDQDLPNTTSVLLTDPASVKVCVDFLVKFVGGKSLVGRIQQLGRDFEKSVRSSRQAQDTDVESLSTDEILLNEASTFFKSAVDVALSYPHVRKTQSWHPTIVLAVEAYFLHCVHRSIFQQLCIIFSKQDAVLNKFIRHASMLKLDPSNLGIRSSFNVVLPRARRELLRIVDMTTPRAKLECLNRCMSAVLTGSDESDFAVSADDLLPTIIYILTKSNVFNWFAQLHFMSDFQLAKSLNPTVLNPGDKASFHLATLEAALEHIKSGGLNKPCSFQEPSSEDSVSKFQTSSSALKRLFAAIEENDVDGAKNILETDSPDASDLSSDERTMCHPLCGCQKCSELSEKTHFSARRDDLKISLYQADERGWTPLHFAASIGRPLLIELFLTYDRRSADVTDNDARTALHIAAIFGHQNALLLLLHAEVDFNQADNDGNTPLILASSNGNTSCVKALLYYAEHQSRPVDLDASNVVGDTSLHVSARFGFVDIVKILLDYGVKVNSKNKRRETPISCAQNLHLAFLLRRASLMESQNTASFASADDPFASYLMKKYVDHDEDEKVSRVLKAIKLKNPQLARAGKFPILSRRSKDKVSINAQDSDNCTGLHVAAVVGNSTIVNLLLRSGAILTKDITGQTPLHVACQNGHLSVVELLLSASSSDIVNAQDRRGQTALHLCVATGNIDIVNILLSRGGANMNLKNNAGKSPLDLAANHAAIFELMKRHAARRKKEDQEHDDTQK